MYFIITTMAWSRCRRRLEREQEGGAQGPAERRHEGRVSQPARQRDLRAVERELRGERYGRGTQCSGCSIAERRVGAAGPQEEPERARAEGYGTPREHGSAGCARRHLPDEVQRIQHQCCEPVRNQSVSRFLDGVEVMIYALLWTCRSRRRERLVLATAVMRRRKTQQPVTGAACSRKNQTSAPSRRKTCQHNGSSVRGSTMTSQNGGSGLDDAQCSAAVQPIV